MRNQRTKQDVTSDIVTREARRKQIAQYLQQNMSETGTAQKLNVHIATVYRDIEHLKQVANQFVYSLAKDSLAYFYKDILDNLKKARLNAWSIYNRCREQEKREKLLALKTVIASNESMFNLLQAGPTVKAVKGIQEQLNTLLDQGSNNTN